MDCFGANWLQIQQIQPVCMYVVSDPAPDTVDIQWISKYHLPQDHLGLRRPAPRESSGHPAIYSSPNDSNIIFRLLETLYYTHHPALKNYGSRFQFRSVKELPRMGWGASCNPLSADAGSLHNVRSQQGWVRRQRWSQRLRREGGGAGAMSFCGRHKWHTQHTHRA